MLKNKTFDILKWIAILGLPTVAWLVGEIGPLWGWEYVQEITLTMQRVAVALGALLGVSTIEYTKSGRPER